MKTLTLIISFLVFSLAHSQSFRGIDVWEINDSTATVIFNSVAPDSAGYIYDKLLERLSVASGKRSPLVNTELESKWNDDIKILEDSKKECARRVDSLVNKTESLSEVVGQHINLNNQLIKKGDDLISLLFNLFEHQKEKIEIISTAYKNRLLK